MAEETNLTRRDGGVPEAVDYFTVRLSRVNGDCQFESNCRFVSDQIGLLEFALMRVKQQWAVEQAQRSQPRIVTGAVVPRRPV